MENNKHPSGLNVRHKIILVQVLSTLLTLCAAESIVLGLWGAPYNGLQRLRHIVIILMLVTPISSVIAIVISRRIPRRLKRALEISRAWLRGNFSLRINDRVGDDLGRISKQMDLIAEHIEEDEEDLEALRESNSKLTDQVRALAVVEERNRLARELHDSVKQHLFSLAMTASAIRTRIEMEPGKISEDLAEMAREIETAAQTAQRETTRLIEDLRPGSLEEQGLSQALNDYTLLFGAQEHILVYLDVQCNDKLLPPSTTEALYRITQEALHNVAHHAHASRVDISLHCSARRVSLTIDDNGIGFDTAASRQGLGIANMQERLMSIGGKLSLRSELSIGTTVIAEVGIATDEAPTEQPHLPNLRPDNWAWLGQRLVIPVGQVWPWPPGDQWHLRQPRIDPTSAPLQLKKQRAYLGLGHTYSLMKDIATVVEIHPGFNGHDWRIGGALWSLQNVRGRRGRLVLKRKGQPLAAMHYQGRQMHTWSEIIYDDRGYQLSYENTDNGIYTLTDDSGKALLQIEKTSTPQVTIHHEISLHLLTMVLARVIDELTTASIAAH